MVRLIFWISGSCIFSFKLKVSTYKFLTTCFFFLKRNKIGIVPQYPLIFSGTLRENLNPKGDFSDDSITRVVQKCQLTGLVRQLGGLGGGVGEGGSFLSAGQKQLVQLARAMLTNPKVHSEIQITINFVGIVLIIVSSCTDPVHW